jgi:hypothetical protein
MRLNHQLILLVATIAIPVAFASAGDSDSLNRETLEAVEKGLREAASQVARSPNRKLNPQSVIFAHELRRRKDQVGETA